ncbi:LacI family DNA-binding transcriptional regulator [Streptomyces sp. RKCA744]|uniref:LacI family DNA-binding transcriptional regulator n=1 Tax=Streptomyces sp. RKCA744 TaxID=2959340 RepID=UPI00263F92B2|nr:LacI family DNA-binding transcriptional regulator [Streptomyces sp. RKCA744]
MAHQHDPGQRPPTSYDVARLAGCSQAAVSLWVTGNHVGRLSVDLQARIAAAVSELGYSTNRAAQRLSTGHGKTITFFFPGFRYDYFGSILDGVTQVLGRSWEIRFVDLRPLEDRHAPESLFQAAGGADSTVMLVASPSKRDLEALALLNRHRIVVIDAPECPPGASLVHYDMAPAIDRMSAHLAALGHRSIGYLALAGAASMTLEHREAVLRAATEHHGSRITHTAEAGTGAGEDSAKLQHTLSAWLEAGVTALVCADERLAYAVLRVASRSGIRIPQQLSMVSFNDSDVAAFLRPGLASIRLLPEPLGSKAAEIIRRNPKNPRMESIAAGYIARQSAAPARR